jgi:hypothetical protein
MFREIDRGREVDLTLAVRLSTNVVVSFYLNGNFVLKSRLVGGFTGEL